MTSAAENISSPTSTARAPWQRMAAGGGLLDAAGGLRSTVFEEMTGLARRTGFRAAIAPARAGRWPAAFRGLPAG